jgi:hypothetical protein
MQYRVVIEEQIVERSVYIVDAVDTLAAAREASRLLVNDVRKPDKQTASIEDRNFTVMTPNKPANLGHGVRAHAVLALYGEHDLD